MTTTTRQSVARGSATRAGPETTDHPLSAEPVASAVVVPVPPKPRRRWGLLAAMVTLVCLGVLGNVWLLGAVADTQQVLAASVTIERGKVINREALISVEVSADPALATVPAGQLDVMVGQRAAVDIVAGSLLTPASATTANLPGDGLSLVGVAVTSASMPTEPLVAGDRIRIVATESSPGQPAASDADAGPVVESAVVVSAVAGTDLAGQGTQTIVTVQVPEASAPQLAAMAATGRVAIVLDSRDR